MESDNDDDLDNEGDDSDVTQRYERDPEIVPQRGGKDEAILIEEDTVYTISTPRTDNQLIPSYLQGSGEHSRIPSLFSHTYLGKLFESNCSKVVKDHFDLLVDECTTVPSMLNFLTQCMDSVFEKSN